MAGLGDYVKAGVEQWKKALVPFIIGFVIVIVLNAVPSLIFWILAPIGSLVASVYFVGLILMAIKVRKGEAAEIGDSFSVTEMLVPATITLAPVPVLNLLALIFGRFVSVGLMSLVNLVAVIVTIVLAWAPFVLATKKCTFMEAWMGSLDFWKKAPVENLITLIVGGILCIPALLGLCVLTTYYMDKAGIMAFTPPASAPAAPATK